MSNLIDRQAAIEYIKLQKWRRFDGMTIEDAILTMIREVPSAQPEIIRCKDCKYSSPNKVYGCRIHSFADELDKRMYADDFCSFAERRSD